MFREQVGTVSTWFDRWSDCEKTVAMVALLRRLQPTQARFLTAVLHRQLVDCGDLRRAEILANDPSFVASLASTESKEVLIRDLLAYLPLLSPKNTEVKTLYLTLIPKVLKYTLDSCALMDNRLMEDARQLLSYSLIHPAFNLEDRQLFATWLHQFEEKLNSTPVNGSNNGLNDGHYPSSLSGSPPDFVGGWQQANSPNGSPSQGGILINNFGGSNSFHKIRRSNSLTPPVQISNDAWNSQEELFSTTKPRSLSLSSEVSPQSSLASSGGSGSESHLDDPRPSFTNPGMKDVPSWLKSLRLHKYSFLFAHLTFESMLELTEERLEAQGVTKGARHKIVLSIGKLKDRTTNLKQLYEEMTGDKDSIRNCLTEVKWMLTTPIKPSPPEGEEGNNGTAGITNNSGNATDSNNTNTTTGNNNTSQSVNIGPIGSNRFQEEKLPENNSEWQAVNQRNRDSDVSLPTWVVRVIGKACELNPDIECEGLLVSILDKCLSHDAFTYKQKRLLSLWRQQQAPIARRNSIGHHSHFHGHMHRSNGSPNNGNSKHNRHFTPRVLTLGNQMGNVQTSAASSWSPSSSIHANFMAKRPSLQDSILEACHSKFQVQRTKSAPLPNFLSSLSCSPPLGSNFEGLSSIHTNSGQSNNSTLLSSLGGLDFASARLLGHPANNNSNPANAATNATSAGSGNNNVGSSAMDITSRLESLCLSMTEAALGPAFSSY